jgi:hypothetical protein
MRLRTCSPSIPFSGWAKCLPTVVVTGRRVHYPTAHVPDLVDLETFVTFCGMVRLRATVLGRLGWKPSPHPRAHALSCPPPAIYFGPGHRHFTRPALCHRAGVLRGVGPSLFSRQNNSMEEMHADLSVSILCR